MQPQRNWRDLLKPQTLETDEKSLGATYGKFVGEPFERGFGTTIGNALRRVLLSSLQGAAIAAVKPGGRAVLIGIPRQDRIAFTASVARRKDLTIKVIHRMKHTYPRAIRLVSKGIVDVDSLVTHRFPLSETVRGYSVAESRSGIKVIIEC